MADGYWTYKILIDPLTRGLRKKIASFIEPGSRILDIACGTGSLLTELSPGIKSGTGIDLNEGKIELANRLAKRNGLSNISFMVADATSLTGLFDKKFDYVILSLAVHQFPEPLRSEIIEEAFRACEKLIIADYAIPLPANIPGFIAKTIERLAGEEHYTSFKSFAKSEGLKGIVDNKGYIIEEELFTGSGVFSIAMLTS